MRVFTVHPVKPSIILATIVVCILFVPGYIQAQQYDIVLKNGHVIDPKNKIDAKMDVAIKDGKIASVANNIPVMQATKLIDVSGLYVTPGFIDLHTHVFVGGKPETFADGSYSISPDDFTLRNGITTVVDAGTSGWRNFPVFKDHVIDKSKTRILAFLNIAGNGMTGSPYEQDMNDMDVYMTSLVAKKYPETIVGIKIGHFEGSEWTPFDRALEAAKISDRPLFVECHLPQFSLEDQLKRMRPGDIITHSFEKVSERMPVVDDQGNLRPFVLDAQKKGVLFDLGHGGAGFWYSVAIPAMKQGLAPNTFGTDLHRFSINAGMKDMSNVMSKYMALGMLLPDVILRATWNAAKAVKHEELGNLSVGAVADVSVFRVREGKFGFVDAGGNSIEGNRKIEAELTISSGKIMWDLNGISAQKLK
jgi:dihydroorotase